jgi:hypothetical protein
MKRALVLTAALGACLLVPLGGTAAGPRDVTCPQDTQSFTGTANNLIVPADGFCEVAGATIEHDLIVGDEAGVFVHETTIGHDLSTGTSEVFAQTTSIGHDLRAAGPDADVHLETTTIDHDFWASQPSTVQTGKNDRDSPGGPVSVGHDFTIDGSPEGDPFVFDGICSSTVGHDLRVTGRSVTLGLGLGDVCAAQGKQPNTIGHDLVVSGDTALAGRFGPSAIEVGGNRVGHDLVFTGNTALPGGYLEVADNTIGHDAACSGNAPAPAGDAGDGPNHAGHADSCG